MNVEMKVLFVCTDDYPFTGACTSLLRNMFFEGKLVEKISQLDVLTVKYRLDDIDKVLDKGINVHRILSWQFIYVDEIRKKIKKHPFLSLFGVFQKALLVCNRRLFPHNYFNPPTVRAFLRGLNKVNALQYQAIVAVGGDFHAVEAVRRYIKNHHGPRFILYQVDPCYSKMTESSVTLNSRKKFECQVYSSADLVLTTPIIRNEAAHNHCKPYVHKFVAIEFPNVTKYYANYLQQKRNSKKDKTIMCLFAGSIYSNIRDPRYTLELFKKLNNDHLRLILVGVRKEQLPEEYNTDWIQCMGVRSLDETRDMIANADLLVNIGNAMKNQVPSKLFEYISTGLPIVNIYKNEDCPSLQYMDKYPCAINLIEDPQKMNLNAVNLKNFICTYAGRQSNIEEILQIYARCTPEYCAGQMLKAIAEN